MKNKNIKEKEKKYWNVALSKDTYSELLKRGGKGESFDEIVSKILKNRKKSLYQSIEVGSPTPEISSI
jgi:predicted CopG family antitoxin